MVNTALKCIKKEKSTRKLCFKYSYPCRIDIRPWIPFANPIKITFTLPTLGV
jgi:hypothetical protein